MSSRTYELRPRARTGIPTRTVTDRALEESKSPSLVNLNDYMSETAPRQEEPVPVAETMTRSYSDVPSHHQERGLCCLPCVLVLRWTLTAWECQLHQTKAVMTTETKEVELVRYLSSQLRLQTKQSTMVGLKYSVNEPVVTALCPIDKTLPLHRGRLVFT